MSDYNLQQEVSDKYSLRGRVFHKIREDILNGKYKQITKNSERRRSVQSLVYREHLSEKHSGSLNSKDF